MMGRQVRICVEERTDGDEGGGGSGDAIDLERVEESAVVLRGFRAGDRLRRAGGSRKLQDVLTDMKMPRDRRRMVPLLTAGGGRVLWMAGVGVAFDVRAHAGSRRVLRVECAADRREISAGV